MEFKNTVAIIGAATSIGATIANKLTLTHRLVLMDVVPADVVILKHNLQAIHPTAAVEWVSCCKDASWEADMIIVAVDNKHLHEIAVRIKEVTTCKTVVHIITDKIAAGTLQQLLPHAHVAAVVLEENSLNNGDLQHAFIQGTNAAAIAFATEVVTALGCTAQHELVRGSAA